MCYDNSVHYSTLPSDAMTSLNRSVETTIVKISAVLKQNFTNKNCDNI
jgi:hypothetical protein